MFDKVTHTTIEAVHLGGEKTWIEKLGLLVIPGLALLLSAASILVSLKAYTANQEGLIVNVQRDEAAAIDVVHPEGYIAIGFELHDKALLSRWKVSVINTSLTAIAPITAIRVISTGALGSSTTLDTETPVFGAQTSIRDGAGNDVVLPLGIKPGEVASFQVTVTSPVSSVAFSDHAPTGTPATKSGEFMMMTGEKGLDPFGNRGDPVPWSFEGTSSETIHEPCVVVSFKTGRGNEYSAYAYWYQFLYRKVGNDLTPVSPPACIGLGALSFPSRF